MSKFTISRITFAIKRFQEQKSKRIFIPREWPAMAGEAEKNLSVDAYMSPPILIFDVLSCYGGVMNHLYCPVCVSRPIFDLLDYGLSMNHVLFMM